MFITKLFKHQQNTKDYIEYIFKLNENIKIHLKNIAKNNIHIPHIYFNYYLKYDSVTISDKVGSGKTLTALNLLDYDYLNLIVVPNHIFKQWIREINKHVNPKYLNLFHIISVKNEIILNNGCVLIKSSLLNSIYQKLFNTTYRKKYIIYDEHIPENHEINKLFEKRIYLYAHQSIQKMIIPEVENYNMPLLYDEIDEKIRYKIYKKYFRGTSRGISSGISCDRNVIFSACGTIYKTPDYIINPCFNDIEIKKTVITCEPDISHKTWKLLNNKTNRKVNKYTDNTELLNFLIKFCNKKLIHNFKNNECNICYDEYFRKIILRCCNNLICLECLKKIKICPFCKSKISEVIGIYNINKTKKNILSKILIDNKKTLIFSINKLNDFTNFNILQSKKIIEDYTSGNLNNLVLNINNNYRGLDLVETERIIFYDIITDREYQAIGRALRLGRKKKLEIIYLAN